MIPAHMSVAKRAIVQKRRMVLCVYRCRGGEMWTVAMRGVRSVSISSESFSLQDLAMLRSAWFICSIRSLREVKIARGNCVEAPSVLYEIVGWCKLSLQR